ncbi:DNA cytosine methyltransferase [Oscillospiraceae bacterium 38-13]
MTGCPSCATPKARRGIYPPDPPPFPKIGKGAGEKGLTAPLQTILGDITQLHGGAVPPVDIITFGSPCQNLSSAGRREGLGGAKSNLFFQAVRLIEEMRDTTGGQFPTIVIWENVMGALLSGNRLDFRAVLQSLTDTEIPMPASGRWANAGMVRGGGRDMCWRLLDAQH